MRTRPRALARPLREQLRHLHASRPRPPPIGELAVLLEDVGRGTKLCRARVPSHPQHIPSRHGRPGIGGKHGNAGGNLHDVDHARDRPIAYCRRRRATLAPKRSGRRTIAISSPGRRTSSAYCRPPVVLATESSRGRRLPISFQSFGSLSATSLGGGSLHSVGRELAECGRTLRCLGARRCPWRPLISSARTPQRAAAARTSMIRAAAPTLRICSQELESDVLPPVTM